MNKLICVYPFTADSLILLNNRDLWSEGDQYYVSSFSEDILSLYGAVDKKSIIPNLEQNLMSFDYLLVPPDADVHKFQNYSRVIDKSLSIDCPIVLSETQRHFLGLNNSQTIELKREIGFDLEKAFHQMIDQLPVPVVGVTGSGDNCDKFLLEVKCKRILEQTEYKTVFVCSNSLGSRFGMYTIPSVVFSKTITFAEKVRLLNYYLWRIYFSEKPDLIVVGIPGGTMRLPGDVGDSFSEQAHIWSYATEFDAVFYNLYNDISLTTEMCEDLSDSLLTRFGFPVHAFVKSRFIAKKYKNTCDYDFYNVQQFIEQEEMTTHGLISIEDDAAIRKKLEQLICALHGGVYTV